MAHGRWLLVCLLSLRHLSAAVHVAHVHLARPDAEEELPRDGVIAVDGIKNSGLGVERHVAPDDERELIRIPEVARAAEGVCADAERRVLLCYPQKRTVAWPQQLVLVHQL